MENIRENSSTRTVIIAALIAEVIAYSIGGFEAIYKLLGLVFLIGAAVMGLILFIVHHDADNPNNTTTTKVVIGAIAVIYLVIAICLLA